MKILKVLIILGCIGLSACTHLTAAERHQIRDLEAKGISVDHPQSNWDKPANPGVAGALNLLPGFGNFYLASGNGADSTQWLYGVLNLLTWPLSILWGVPEAAVDATVINERELIYHYTYEKKSSVFNQYYNYHQ